MNSFLNNTRILAVPLSIILVLFPIIGETGNTENLSLFTPSSITSTKISSRPPEALEEPIDPDEYFVGPGDVLAINLWGELSSDFVSTISPEGTIIIPTVSTIDLQGLTLSEAKAKISSAVLKRYRKTAVSVTLVNTRTFKVSVTGAVLVPGVYIAQATDRVSALLEEAGGLIGYRDVEKGTLIPDYLHDEWNYRKEANEKDDYKLMKPVKASKRGIILKRRDDTTIRVDLLKYERTGELDNNPMVLDGDVIVVPIMQDKINRCGIFGAVKDPGFFEYFNGDRVSDLLKLTHGLTLNADITAGYLIRFAEDKISTIQINLDILSILEKTGGISDLELLPDDRVFIKVMEPYHDKKQVYIEGEVRFPGTYWIESDSVKLSELIKRAGNPTPYANLRQAEMVRRSMESLYDPEFERLKEMNVSDMNQMEYEYFKMRSREKPGRVSLDLTKLLLEGDPSYDIPLRNGDSINIPRHSMTISVTGQVKNRGLTPFVEGEKVGYYISKAGGFTQKARKSKVRIIKRNTGEWVKPRRKNLLKPGDAIWVPEKPERNYWKIAKDVLIFTGNLATVYLVIRQATK